jgi:hypothetical protein
MKCTSIIGLKRSATAAFGLPEGGKATLQRDGLAPDTRNDDKELLVAGCDDVIDDRDTSKDTTATVDVWQRARRRRTDPTNGGVVGGVPYAHAICPDLQHKIMKTLIQLDPASALRLAASDSQHRAILESLESSVLYVSALMPTDMPITARRLLAANVGLSGRLAGGASPQDWEAAVAVSLMEGFVRYLFTGGRITLAATRVWKESTAYARFFDYDTDYAGDTITDILEKMTLEERVVSLYEWIMKGSFGALLTKNRQSRLRDELLMRHIYKGYFNRHDSERYLSDLRAVGVRVGDHPPKSWKNSDAVDRLGAEGRALQPILVFPQHAGQVFPNAIQRAECPLTWRTGPLGETRTAPIRSLDAETAIRDHLDDVVRQHMTGPCAQIQASGHVALPAFSDFFPGAIYLANTVPDVTLYMDLRSPRIERLLGESFAY